MIRLPNFLALSVCHRMHYQTKPTFPAFTKLAQKPVTLCLPNRYCRWRVRHTRHLSPDRSPCINQLINQPIFHACALIRQKGKATTMYHPTPSSSHHSISSSPPSPFPVLPLLPACSLSCIPDVASHVTMNPLPERIVYTVYTFPPFFLPQIYESKIREVFSDRGEYSISPCKSKEKNLKGE